VGNDSTRARVLTTNSVLLKLGRVARQGGLVYVSESKRETWHCFHKSATKGFGISQQDSSMW